MARLSLDFVVFYSPVYNLINYKYFLFIAIKFVVMYYYFLLVPTDYNDHVIGQKTLLMSYVVLSLIIWKMEHLEI